MLRDLKMIDMPAVLPGIQLPPLSIFGPKLSMFSFAPTLNLSLPSRAPDIRDSIKLFSRVDDNGNNVADSAEQHFDYYSLGANRERLVNRFRFCRRDATRHYSADFYQDLQENFTVETQDGRPMSLAHFSKYFAEGSLIFEETNLYVFESQHHCSFY